MFEIVEIETEEPLIKLVIDVKEKLTKTVKIVQYPTDLREKKGENEWRLKYKEIDKLNIKLLKHISNRDGIYTIFTLEDNNLWKVRYIGQTQAKTSRQRIRSHIVWRNKKTISGKITGSKFDEVQKSILLGQTLGFSFVEIHPEPLRHYVEENLIKDLQPPWNQHGANQKQA